MKCFGYVFQVVFFWGQYQQVLFDVVIDGVIVFVQQVFDGVVQVQGQQQVFGCLVLQFVGGFFVDVVLQMVLGVQDVGVLCYVVDCVGIVCLYVLVGIVQVKVFDQCWWQGYYVSCIFVVFGQVGDIDLGIGGDEYQYILFVQQMVMVLLYVFFVLVYVVDVGQVDEDLV